MDPITLATSATSMALDALNAAKSKFVKNVAGADARAQAKATAQDFEGVFLNSMLQQMFTAVDGEGPLGGKGSAGIWRSFLTDEYAKSFSKAGGIGIADHVYRALIAQQEARS